MGVLTKEQIRNRGVEPARKFANVSLSDGSVIRLRSLTRAEQREWYRATKKKDGTVDKAKIEYSDDVLLALSIVDDNDQPTFTITEALNGIFDFWATNDTKQLVEVAAELSGLIVDQAEIDAALKNSAATPGNGSCGVSSQTGTGETRKAS